jgi:hypothetical protein
MLVNLYQNSEILTHIAIGCAVDDFPKTRVKLNTQVDVTDRAATP